MNKKFKIIIGVSGYIGKQLAKNFKEKNVNFIGIDKEPRDEKSTIKLDLKNRKKTFKFFNNIDCDEIFHFGTYSATDYKKDFDTCFFEDFVSLQNLLFSIKKNKRKIKLIYMSSSYVYSGYKNNKLLYPNLLHRLETHLGRLRLILFTLEEFQEVPLSLLS